MFILEHSEVALARKERKTGSKHTDFEIQTDQQITIQEDLRRRDITINAMAIHVLTGELVDPFGGKEDLEKHLIRKTSDAFIEDPLRAYRVARFASTLGFDVTEDTLATMQQMKEELSQLSAERVFIDFRRALVSPHPSIFFETLRKAGILEVHFQELNHLIGVEQPIAYHPEGDAFVHTMIVLKKVVEMTPNAQIGSDEELTRFCALVHDFGKAVSTVIGGDKISAINHRLTGINIAKRFLRRISNEIRLERYVLNMVELHMGPNMMADANSSEKATARMFDQSACPEDLLLLAKADHLGKGTTESYSKSAAFLQERLALYKKRMAQPYVQGRDPIEAGFEPGVAFSEALKYAHKLRLAGIPKEEALAQTKAYIRKSGGS